MFSKEYLEIIKCFGEWERRTKKIVVFIYKEILSMLHPAVPFITSFLHNKLFKTDIKEFEETPDYIHIINDKSCFWQVECCLLIIKNVRELKKNNIILTHIFFEIFKQKEEENVTFLLDINFLLEKSLNIKLFFLEGQDIKSFSSVSIFPFGVVWYKTEKDIEKLEKELSRSIFESERSRKILDDINFIKKAPSYLIDKEKKQLIYYENEKKKIETQIKKIKQIL